MKLISSVEMKMDGDSGNLNREIAAKAKSETTYLLETLLNVRRHLDECQDRAIAIIDSEDAFPSDMELIISMCIEDVGEMLEAVKDISGRIMLYQHDLDVMTNRSQSN